MVNEISIMVLAIVIAVGVMMFAAKAIGDPSFFPFKRETPRMCSHLET
jgi:hypothetical protein